VRDWQSGREIDPRGRKKVLRAAGLASRSGDSARQFAGFTRFLQREHGFVPGDFLDATYAGRGSLADWTPQAYEPDDVEKSLAVATDGLANLLRWYDRLLPLDIELHLLGFSLGGVIQLRAAGQLLEQEPARWRVRLASVVTLASPHFGCDLADADGLVGMLGLGALFGQRPASELIGVLAGGDVGREICRLSGDPAHRQMVLDQARRLRHEGVELLTLADDFDTVVRPAEAVIAPDEERERYVLETSRYLVGGPKQGDPFGHGPLLDNPKAWRMMAEVIGDQEPREGAS
jgi:hypothetical protein